MIPSWKGNIIFSRRQPHRIDLMATIKFFEGVDLRDFEEEGTVASNVIKSVASRTLQNEKVIDQNGENIVINSYAEEWGLYGRDAKIKSIKDRRNGELVSTWDFSGGSLLNVSSRKWQKSTKSAKKFQKLYKNNMVRGDDKIIGSDENDVLLGWNGHDQLNGGEGDDVLIGGKGANTYEGGKGMDLFVIEKGDSFSRDNIKDFNPLEDKIILNGIKNANYKVKGKQVIFDISYIPYLKVTLPGSRGSNLAEFEDSIITVKNSNQLSKIVDNWIA